MRVDVMVIRTFKNDVCDEVDYDGDGGGDGDRDCDSDCNCDSDGVGDCDGGDPDLLKVIYFARSEFTFIKFCAELWTEIAQRTYKI